MRSLPSPRFSSFIAADASAGTGTDGEVRVGIGAAMNGVAVSAGVARSDGAAGADLAAVVLQPIDRAAVVLESTGLAAVVLESTGLAAVVLEPTGLAAVVLQPIDRAAVIVVAAVVVVAVVVVAVAAAVVAAAAGPGDPALTPVFSGPADHDVKIEQRHVVCTRASEESLPLLIGSKNFRVRVVDHATFANGLSKTITLATKNVALRHACFMKSRSRPVPQPTFRSLR
jgi:hypothetical protein